MTILSSEKVRRRVRCDRRVVRPIVLFFCSFFLISFFNAASAQDCGESNHDYYVDVTNDTGYTIYYLYVSHEDEKTWGDDLLGSNVLNDGLEMRVFICNYSSPVFDIQVEDEDGDTYTFYSIDVSRQDLTVRLSDLD